MVTEALLASARARCDFATMLHVTITLSEAQEAQLSARIAAGEFASIDDYVVALVVAETEQRAQEQLEEQLMAGYDSPSLRWTPELMDDIKAAARLRR